MVNYWTVEEIALMVLLVEACNKKYEGISGYYFGKTHVYLPFYKRFHIIGNILKRSTSATRRKYNAYIDGALKKTTTKAVAKHIALQKRKVLDFSELLEQQRHLLINVSRKSKLGRKKQ